MENQITCPHCQRKISDHPVVDSAAKREGADTQFLLCECGERITYWQITAQLRDQKKIGFRLKHWLRGLGKSQG